MHTVASYVVCNAVRVTTITSSLYILLLAGGVVINPLFASFILEMNGQTDVEVDYKRKYKNLKRKLKFLVYVSTDNLYVFSQSLAITFSTLLTHMCHFLHWFRVCIPFLQEQECFQEELRRSQRKLLKVSRDKRWGHIFAIFILIRHFVFVHICVPMLLPTFWKKHN